MNTIFGWTLRLAFIAAMALGGYWVLYLLFSVISQRSF